MILAFTLAIVSLLLLGIWGLFLLEEKGREVVIRKGGWLVRKEAVP